MRDFLVLAVFVGALALLVRPQLVQGVVRDVRRNTATPPRNDPGQRRRQETHPAGGDGMPDTHIVTVFEEGLEE